MSALTNWWGRESSRLRGKPVAGYPPTKGSSLPILPRGEGRGEGGSTYIPSTYILYQNSYFVNRDKRVHKNASGKSRSAWKG